MILTNNLGYKIRESTDVPDITIAEDNWEKLDKQLDLGGAFGGITINDYNLGNLFLYLADSLSSFVNRELSTRDTKIDNLESALESADATLDGKITTLNNNVNVNRTITFSTSSSPSGGKNGDIWFVYS